MQGWIVHPLAPVPPPGWQIGQTTIPAVLSGERISHPVEIAIHGEPAAHVLFPSAAQFAAVVTLLHVALVPSLAPLVQGAAWVVATGMAWMIAVRRNFAQHRQWMIRSYALTTTFVSTRLLFSIPALDHRLSADGTAIIILCAVTLTIVAAEVGIQLDASGHRKTVGADIQVRNANALASASEKRFLEPDSVIR